MLIEGGTLKNGSMRGQLATAPDAVRFIAAGRGTFTLESVTTGSRFTYKVTASEDRKVLFVKLLTGADNTNSYTYIGFVRVRNLSYSHGAKSPVKATAGSVLALRWALERLADGVLPKTLRVWHEGKCGRCARKLTVPASVATGFGPECAGHVGVEWAVPVCEAA